MMIIIVEKGTRRGNGVINLAGGYGLISFAIDNGSSQHNPSKNPIQNRYQWNLSILWILYKICTIRQSSIPIIQINQ
jgi:hypothetical protein